MAGSSYESCLLKFSDPSKITLFMATSRFTDDSVMTLAVAADRQPRQERGLAR